MSSVVIMTLIVVSVVVLMMIVYANHLLEASRLEKARQRADLSDRVKRCAHLAESLPGQFTSPALKFLLARLERALAQRLAPLERGNQALTERLAELESQVEAGEAAFKANPPRPMDKEAKVKELRFQLEALHGQLGRAVQDGLLPTQEAQRWVAEIKKMLVMANCELFESMGRQALRQDQPRQARLAFERGVQYLRKQPDPDAFKPQLGRLEERLENAERLVLAADAPRAEAPSELTEGIEAIADDGWKKKNIYD